ncbi:MAG: Zn-dependent hydrolase [Firmicutes bacterium HGW-Firmicutes-15]|nr:MAG: Zn-dependent hydrolase [Firmicutes bacterium HGW-Firmicutes-15]
MLFKFENIVGTYGSREMPWNPPFRMKVYYYLIDGLLIDTGPFSMAAEGIAFFDSHTIKQVFLTHIHEDHAGMAYWLQENKQLPIYIHPDSVEEALIEPDLSQYRLDIWGRRQAFKAEPVSNTIRTDSYVFKVIDSPGHCRKHNSLYEENKGWLFLGDLLNNLTPRSIFFEENLSESILSIRKILCLNFNTVLCPHTGILPNGRELLTRKLNYLLQLQQEIKTLRIKGFTDKEIDGQLFPGPDSISQMTGGDFSSYYIVSTL